MNLDPNDEIFALDTLLIETFWEHFLRYLKANAGKIMQGSITGERKRIGRSEIEALRLSSAESLKAAIAADPFENIWQLRDSVSTMGTIALWQYCQECETSGDNPVYERLKQLMDSRPNPQGIAESRRLLVHLHKGLNSAVYITFDLLRSLPFALDRIGATAQNEQEFRLVAQNSQELLLRIASMDRISFTSLRNGAQRYFQEEMPSLRPKMVYGFPRNFFVLAKASGPLQICPDFLQVWKKNYDENDPSLLPRRGCPARLSKSGEGGKSTVILDLFELQIENFLKYLFPHLKAYVESGRVK